MAKAPKRVIHILCNNELSERDKDGWLYCPSCRLAIHPAYEKQATRTEKCSK